MQSIKVLYAQELADLVSEQQLFEAADLNGISITEALTPGVTLSIPDEQPRTLVTRTIQTKPKDKTVKAIAGQTWVDLAIQECGDEGRIFELCDLNNAGITDELQIGVTLKSLEPNPDKNRIVNKLMTLKPSSMYYGTGDPAPEGIEYWAIEIDFKVS